MAALSSQFAVTDQRWQRLSGIVPIALATLVVTSVGVATSLPATVRAAVALPAVALLVAMCLTSPRRSIILLMAWLGIMGTVRRLLLPSDGPGDSDPLLLVAPVVLALLLVVATRHGAFSEQSRLSKSVLLLGGLVVAAALNPLQGSIAIGAAGLLFVLVPTLWFWVGRALIDDELLTRILRVIAFISLGAAAYGLFQVYVGLPSWDRHWVETKGYVSLNVAEGAVRPFASFSSSSEYVGLLTVGTILWALRLRKATQTLPAVAALGILGWALTVASVRGALVVVPIALGMTFAASRGFGVGRIALFGIAALFVLGFVVTRFDPGQVGGARTSALVSRSVSGLSDPFNPEVSTLPVHIEALVSGLRQAFQNPLGRGVGVVTIAADKFGADNASTDVDPSNVAVAMGIPGLLVYGAVIYFALRLAFGQARRERRFLTLAALGIALVTLLQWLNGGSYAVAPLPWLVLGWLDARSGVVQSTSSEAPLGRALASR